MIDSTAYVDAAALVDPEVDIGAGTRVWALTQVRRGARIGAGCTVGARVTVDTGVVIGDRCKVQNDALLFHGVRLGDGVFIGPGAVLTNDRLPRAVSPDGAPLRDEDWIVSRIDIAEGASVGANATIVAGVRVGAWAMIGAGAVVTRDVPPHALVLGVPARQRGWVCFCGHPARGSGEIACASCGRTFTAS